MFLTTEEFLNGGLPVSDDISTYEVEEAISMVEDYFIRPRLTDENFIELEAYNDLPAAEQDPNDDEYILIHGGAIDNKRYAGLKKAEKYLVFAWMGVNLNRLTRFSTVEKNSEYSKSADQSNLERQMRLNHEIGEQFLKEVMSYYNITWDCTLPNILDGLF